MRHDFSGERLRALRKRAMLTQKQVIDLTGISQMTIYNLESGRTRPYTRTLDKLLNLYAIRIQQIKNIDKVFEENANGGNISAQTVVRPGSAGLDARRVAQKT